MRSWLRLVKAVAQVEFPDFEGIAAFSVFSLCEKERPAFVDDELMKGETADRKMKCFQVLGRMFSVDPVKLAEQTELHKPIATTRFLETKCTTQDAWHYAKERTRNRLNFLSEELGATLEGFFTFGGSSSGVEQNFSRCLWLISNRQMAAGKHHCEDLMKILLDRRSEEEVAIVIIFMCMLLQPHGERDGASPAQSHLAIDHRL